MVECTGLENRRRLNPSVSSNLTASAISMSRTVRDRSGFSFFRFQINKIQSFAVQDRSPTAVIRMMG